MAFGHCAAPCTRGSGCSPDPRIRKDYGCDEGTEATQGFQIHCWSCGKKPVKSCRICEGSGKIAIKKCPNRLLSREIIAAWRAYTYYRNGFLPSSGAMLDQSHTFLEALSLLDSLYAVHEEIEMDKAKKGK